MLDHSAGIAVAAGAELVVFHPGFLLGRTREEAIAAVVEQLGELRERLEGKGRAVPFGVEVMGRVRELRHGRGRARDLRAARLGPAGARLRAHARDLATAPSPTADAVRRARSRPPTRCSEPGAPFHIHFSDIAYANRNETKHLPYGEGTLRRSRCATRSPASSARRP